MTLVIKSAKHDEETLIDKEIDHKLNNGLKVLVILISCLGAYQLA